MENGLRWPIWHLVKLERNFVAWLTFSLLSRYKTCDFGLCKIDIGVFIH